MRGRRELRSIWRSCKSAASGLHVISCICNADLRHFYSQRARSISARISQIARGKAKPQVSTYFVDLMMDFYSLVAGVTKITTRATGYSSTARQYICRARISDTNGLMS